MDCQRTTAELSRKAARGRGLSRYFTGKACANGHVAERLVSNATCVECAKIKKREWHSSNREYVMARLSAWQKNNRERANANARKCHEKKKEDRLAWGREYRARNKPLFAAKQQKRNARKLSATPSWFGELDEFVMHEAAALCTDRERATGFAWQVDHMIPLQATNACGLHCAANIQVIPATLNRRKRNKMIFTKPFEWLKHG